MGGRGVWENQGLEVTLPPTYSSTHPPTYTFACWLILAVVRRKVTSLWDTWWFRRGHTKQWIITSPENSTHQELNQEPFNLKTVLLAIQLPSSADKPRATGASLTEHTMLKFPMPLSPTARKPSIQ